MLFIDSQKTAVSVFGPPSQASWLGAGSDVARRSRSEVAVQRVVPGRGQPVVPLPVRSARRCRRRCRASQPRHRRSGCRSRPRRRRCRCRRHRAACRRSRRRTSDRHRPRRPSCRCGLRRTSSRRRRARRVGGRAAVVAVERVVALTPEVHGDALASADRVVHARRRIPTPPGVAGATSFGAFPGAPRLIRRRRTSSRRSPPQDWTTFDVVNVLERRHSRWGLEVRPRDPDANLVRPRRQRHDSRRARSA